MSRVVLLLEETSMKVLLDGLLPRLFPQLDFLCVPHEGRNDLARSIPRKLRAWREPGVRFVIVHDNDGGNCAALKAELAEQCRLGGREETLIRIACQELEAWYLGEPEALADAFAHDLARRIGNRAKYRDPDAVARPSNEVARLVPQFQKVSGARLMATRLTRERNRSHSFQVLLNGIETLARTSS